MVMKNIICRLLAAVLMVNSGLMNYAMADGDSDIKNAHGCSVTNKKTGVTVDATCGLKIDPRDKQLHPYRTFTDPSTGLVHEQWKRGSMVDDITRRIDRGTASGHVKTYARPDQSGAVKNDSSESHVGTYLVIGTAVIAVAAIA